MSASRVDPPVAKFQADHCAQSGWGYRRAGRGKHVAHAHGKATCTGTRYQQGVPYSPLARALEPLALCSRTNAFAALTEARILVTSLQLASQTPEWLRDRRSELERDEIDLRRDIDHAKLTGEGMRELRARMADMAQELAAIEDLLEGGK